MDDDDEANGVLPTKPQAVSGGLDGIAEAINTAAEPMLAAATPVTRFILKRIPGAPAMVFDAADWAKDPNKTRATVGLVGSLVGGAGGGAMGAAAGGVNAPIGAALGSAYGEKLGDQLYDEHSAFFDRQADKLNQGAHWLAQGAGDIGTWMAQRWNDPTGATPN